MVDIGGYLRRSREVYTTEPHPVVLWSWLEGHRGHISRVKTDPADRNGLFDRSLLG
jgi:hypothetical protein